MLFRKLKNKVKGKAVGIFGNVSGIGSVISAHSVCHYLCLGVVTILSIIGITVSSTSLMFLEKYSLFFWSMGIFFLLMSLTLYIKYRGCISIKLILFNTSLLIISIPFKSLEKLNLLFWLVGGSVMAISIAMFVKDNFMLKFWRLNNE